jgi:hypothetical protein
MRVADQSRKAGRSVSILFYWFAEDECKGRRDNCVGFMLFLPSATFLEYSYHINLGIPYSLWSMPRSPNWALRQFYAV